MMLQLHQSQLRGEPLGSPLNPGGASARRTTPTDAQPVPIDASLTQSPPRPGDGAAGGESEDTSPESSVPEAAPSTSVPAAAPSTGSSALQAGSDAAAGDTDEEKQEKIKR